MRNLRYDPWPSIDRAMDTSKKAIERAIKADPDGSIAREKANNLYMKEAEIAYNRLTPLKQRNRKDFLEFLLYVYRNKAI